MKKSARLLTAVFVMTVLLSSCEKLPEAGFTFDPAEPVQYEEVTFTNTSTDADSYSWTFGDGEDSDVQNPVHVYTSAGKFTVTLTATNDDGDHSESQEITVAAPLNQYVFGDTTYTIDAEMFWYQSGMGGDPYIRLLTSVDGQENPDLLKIYPNMGLSELPGTYTFEVEGGAGTYDIGYTANYAGMNFDWVGVGTDLSGDLVITEVVTDVYKVECEVEMDVGTYDFSQGGLFIKSGSGTLTLTYTGAIQPLEEAGGGM